VSIGLRTDILSVMTDWPLAGVFWLCET